MTHDEVQDLLEDYVDERLDRSTRKMVDDHLDGCDECRSVLEGVAPVNLGALPTVEWDEQGMRRAVRRSMIRTALNVAGLWLVGWLMVMVLSALVIHPLVVNRGGRAAAATRATADLALMFNPGAAVEEWTFDSGILDRTSEVEVVFPIGNEITSLGTVSSRLTLNSFLGVGGPFVEPQLVRESGGTSQLTDRLELLGEGTVATVELVFADPISLDATESLANSPHDVRVVWAGFAVNSGSSGHGGIGFDPGGIVGYPACDIAPAPRDFAGSGGGMGGGSAFVLPPSGVRAHELIVPALENLVAHSELIEGLGRGWSAQQVDAATDHIREEGDVKVLVVTGPTRELLEFVADARPDFGGIRGVEFINWFNPLCGR